MHGGDIVYILYDFTPKHWLRRDSTMPRQV